MSAWYVLAQVVAAVLAPLVSGFTSEPARSVVHVVFKEDRRMATIQFSHGGMDHTYHLIATSVFAPGAETFVHMDSSVHRLRRPPTMTFRAHLCGHRAAATVNAKGLVHGFFEQDGRFIKVEPAREDDGNQSMLSSLPRHHRIRYIVHPDNMRQRRVPARRVSADWPSDVVRRNSSRRVKHRLIADFHPDFSEPALLLRLPNNETSLNESELTLPDWQGERWFPGCYSGDTHLHDLLVGIVVDHEAWKQHTYRIFIHIEDAISWASLVYEVQLHIRILIGHLKIYMSAAAAPPYAVGCPAGDSLSVMDTKLTQLQDDGDMPYMASTVMFTGCGGHRGVMGLAYVGGMCSGNDNFAVLRIHSWKTEKTFYAFAHELGHVLGASHTFEEGKGTTGGIMDYGDGRLGGIFQFNTKYRKKQMCESANKIVNNCQDKFQRAPDGATARPPPEPRSNEDACFTVGRGGSGKGKRCIFPFIYKGKTYHSCTFRYNLGIWCATKVDWGEVVLPHTWGECPWTSSCIGPHRSGFGLWEWLRVVVFVTCVALLVASMWRCVSRSPQPTCAATSPGEVIGAVAVAWEEPGPDVFI